MNDVNLPEEYKVISVPKFMGWMIAFEIPVVGLILMIIYGFGKPKNMNLRNYARARLSLYCIAIILYFVLSVILTMAGVDVSSILG